MLEDARTLAGFYPLEARRQKVHHLFTHRFLPDDIFRRPAAFFADLLADADQPHRPLMARWMRMEQEAGLAEPSSPPGQAAQSPPLDPAQNPATDQPENPPQTQAQTPLRRITDMPVRLIQLDQRPAVLIAMPEPERPPLSWFIGAVLEVQGADPAAWPADPRARIFTLDMPLDAPRPAAAAAARHSNELRGHFCEWATEGRHRDFGLQPPVTEEDFIQAMRHALTHFPDRWPQDSDSPDLTPQARRASVKLRGPVPAGGRPWWKFW